MYWRGLQWLAAASLAACVSGCAIGASTSPAEDTGTAESSFSSGAYHTQMLRPYDIDRSATFTGGRAYWWARCDDSSDPRWSTCYVTAGAGVAYIDEEGHCRVDLDGGAVTVRLVGYCR